MFVGQLVLGVKSLPDILSNKEAFVLFSFRAQRNFQIQKRICKISYVLETVCFSDFIMVQN